MDSLTVTVSADGVPVAFTVGGDIWIVAADPVRWYERIPWWETETRMPRESGRIDVEVWQLQAAAADAASESPEATFILVRDQNTGEWHLRSVEKNRESSVDPED
ncbi:hypothetical protein WMO79_01120 [Micrococcaceae bacterium Sec7.4]